MSRKSSKIEQLKQALIKQAVGRVAGPSDYGVGSDVARMRGQGMNPRQIGGAFDNDQKALDAKMQASDARLQQMDANRSQLARDQQEIAQWNRQKSQPQARPAQKTQADFNSEYQRRLDVNDYIQQGRAATDANNKAREAGQPLPYQGNSSNNYAGPARQSATPGAAQPSAPQQPAQGGDPYMSSQQAAMKAHPELAQAGSAHNKAFLELVKQNGGADALRKNPDLINQLAQQSKPQTSAPTDLRESVNAIDSDRTQPTSQPAASTNTQEVDDKYSNLPAGFQNPVATATQAQPAASTNTQEVDDKYSNLPASPAPGQSVQAKTPNAPAPTAPSAPTQLQGGNINTGPGVGISTLGQPVQTKTPNAPAQAPAQAPAAPNPNSDQEFLNNPPKDAGQPQYQQALLNAPALSPGTSNFSKPTSLSLGGGVAATGSSPLNKTSEFKEGFVFELNQIKEKRATEEAKKEKDILSHLRTELKKMSAALGDAAVYSNHQIDEFTKTAEAFEKAAQDEAQRVWNGLVKELYKQGADEAFIDGMLKEAASGVGALTKNIGRILSSGAQYPGATVGAIGATLKDRGKDVANLLKANPRAYGTALTEGGELLQHQDGRSALGKLVTSPLESAKGWLGSLLNRGNKGATRMKFVDELEKRLPTEGTQGGIFATGAPSENFRQMMDNMRNEGAEALTKHHSEGLNKTVQNSYQELSREAARGNPVAQKSVAAVGSGDMSPLAEKLKLTPDTVQTWKNKDHIATSTNPLVGAPAPQVHEGMVEHAQQAAKGGFPSNTVRYAPVQANRPGLSERLGLGGMFKFSPGGAMAVGGLGAAGGSLFGPLGTAVGGLGGVALGGLGPGGVALGSLAAGHYGGKALGLWGKDQSPGATKDIYGAPVDRNRAVPFMKNQWSGAIGGALLASMIAREHGMNGPLSWLIPILGGIAGHHFLPQLMNKWKDPHGYGVNSNAGQSNINSRYPMMH